MTDLSTIPEEVNIDHYSGDTLTIHIKASTEVIAGRVFTAQVRSNKNATKIDASFVVYVNAEGADIVLESADCHALTKRGDYAGFWDVQLAMPDGSDPVTTLGQGDLRLHSDVTRAAS